jgi:hypothetical protein
VRLGLRGDLLEGHPRLTTPGDPHDLYIPLMDWAGNAREIEVDFKVDFTWKDLRTGKILAQSTLTGTYERT